MSGATHVRISSLFAVESEDQTPSGSVDSPPLTSTRHKSRATFIKDYGE